MFKNNKLWYSIGAIVIGLLFGILLLFATGQSISEFGTSIYQSSFNDWISFGNLLSVVAWIILISLAFMISFRARIFNIGAAGQFVAAGLFTYALINQLPITGRWAILITLFFPILIGMFFAWLIAFLKTQFKVHEVLSSILLNIIIFWLYIWFISPIHHPAIASELGTVDIASNFSLQFSFWADESFINYGIILAVIALVIFIFMYKKTTWGYRQKVLGSKNKASYYVGINLNQEFTKTMIISGALAGLAGGVFYFGCNQNLPVLTNALPGEAWFGLAIILVAFNNIFGIIIVAFIFGLLENAIVFNAAVGQSVSILNLMVVVLMITSTIFYAFIIYNPQELFVCWFKNVHRKNLYPFRRNHQKDQIKIKNNFSKYFDYIRISKTTYDIKGQEYKKREGK